MTTTVEDLSLLSKLKPLLLTFDALDLFPLLNGVMLSYALLALAPRWKHTAKLSLLIPCFHSFIYVSGLTSIMKVASDAGEEPADFLTFQGVLKMFEDPNVVFVGWVHYIVFDCLVARMIVLDSIQRGASYIIHFLFVVPCMFATLMFGPTGFLSYIILRQIILPGNESAVGEVEKMKIL